MTQTTTQRYRKPDAVKLLELMAAQYTAAEHPNFPAAYIPRKQFRDDTANGLTQCIIAFLTMTGAQAERISTTGRVVMRHGQQLRGGRLVDIATPQYIPTSGVKGSADISATIRGHSVKIEVKAGRDRQRPEQMEYQRRIEQAGGLYVIAHDFPSFLEWYETTFGVTTYITNCDEKNTQRKSNGTANVR